MENRNKTVYLIGAGPGSEGGLTASAALALSASTCIVGAERLLFSLASLIEGKEQKALVKGPQITEYLAACSHETCAVLLSGDIGFYSGAAALLPLLTAKGFAVNTICGISSPVYFCAKLDLPWQDVKMASLHGREGNPLGLVMNHEKVLFLTGSNRTCADICGTLADKGCGGLAVSVGERLSYEDERITRGTAAELAGMQFDDLCVMLVENPHPLHESAGNYGFSDEDFRRGEVPMTKEEVRAVSLSKLRVETSSIVYDIGAGTGSVSAEIACRARYGTVYAVEKKEEALALLKINKEKLGLHNMEIIRGEAPRALLNLPGADRIFIGGSGGGLEEILTLALAKNPSVRIVVNAITLETLTQAVNLFEALEFQDIDICQVAVSKVRRAGSYHMMTAQNPVYIISGEGKGAGHE